MTRMLLCLAAFAISLSLSYGQGNPDEFYILIDSQTVNPCRNANPLIQVTERDVMIRDSRGNRAYYVKAPGDYQLSFQNIRVQEPLPNLSGEISATLQVPLFEGPGGLRFDVPYQAIPQANLLNSQCDAQSGIIQKDGRPYCRYCDLCTTTSQVEQKLNQNHKYLPGLDSNSNEESFSRICTQIDDRSYDLSRTISIPGRKELEDQYRANSPKLEGQLKQKLDKGRGKLQVFLNLLSSQGPPLSQDDFFFRTQGCRCCSQRASNELSCKLLSAINCNREKCKSAYGAQCLQGQTTTATCYTVEFNYRVTDKWADVQAFLREHNYPDASTGAGAGAGAGPGPVQPQGQGQGQAGPQRGGGGTGAGNKQRCVASLRGNANLQRYCTQFWSDNFCCPRCPGSC